MKITLIVWCEIHKDPRVVAIEVDGNLTQTEDYEACQGADRGLHHLLCTAYKKAKIGPLSEDDRNPPQAIVRPLLSAIQKGSQWLKDVFKKHEIVEVFNYGQKDHKASVSFAEKPLITMLVTPDGDVKNATEKIHEAELNALMFRLVAPSLGQPNLKILAYNTIANAKYEIQGYNHDQPLYRGHQVNIQAWFPEAEKAAIFWLSANLEAYQIYPDTDKRLGNIQASITPKDNRFTKSRYRDLTIPQGKGFQIDSRSGKECCILILRNSMDDQELATLVKNLEKAAKKCLALRSSDGVPSRIIFNNTIAPPVEHGRVQNQRLEAPPDDQGWERKLLAEIAIPESKAIMIALPVTSPTAP